MSLTWDDDEASSDDAGWRTRLGAWFAPSSAELVGLAVMVVGALILSGVLWLQASARPTSLTPMGEGSVGEDAVGGGADDHGGDGSVGIGPHDIGVRMDASGTADGHAPGTDEDEHDVDGAAGDDATGPVVVHVTGAVRTAGLVTLPAGARIGDAVVAAGGARADALVERVNLARVLTDGEHVHVPADGDDPTTLPPIGGEASPNVSAAGTPTGTGDGSGDTGPIHLNRASAAELETLPGIGPARAEAIIVHREQQGPFDTPGDLRDVSGIGEATFQRLAPLITVD